MSDTEPGTPPTPTPSTASGTSTVNTVAVTTATPQSGLPPFQPFDHSADPSTIGKINDTPLKEVSKQATLY